MARCLKPGCTEKPKGIRFDPHIEQGLRPSCLPAIHPQKEYYSLNPTFPPAHSTKRPKNQKSGEEREPIPRPVPREE